MSACSTLCVSREAALLAYYRYKHGTPSLEDLANTLNGALSDTLYDLRISTIGAEGHDEELHRCLEWCSG